MSLVFSIPGKLMSPNKRDRHWRNRYNEKKRLMLEIVAAIGKRSTVQIPVAVSIEQYRKRLMDPDNAVSACKPLLDALKALGWLKDDSAEWCRLDVKQLLAVGEPEHVRLRLESEKLELEVANAVR